jgi:hypothetical protein
MKLKKYIQQSGEKLKYNEWIKIVTRNAPFKIIPTLSSEQSKISKFNFKNYEKRKAD